MTACCTNLSIKVRFFCFNLPNRRMTATLPPTKTMFVVFKLYPCNQIIDIIGKGFYFLFHNLFIVIFQIALPKPHDLLNFTFVNLPIQQANTLLIYGTHTGNQPFWCGNTAGFIRKLVHNRHQVNGPASNIHH